MTDRDTFAAAALTGLLAQGDDGSFSEESYARAAYRWADAILRERDESKPPEPCAWKDGVPVAWYKKTNHDAAPAARAEDVLKEPTVIATGEPGGVPEGKIRTGKQPAPPSVETDGFSSGSRTGPIIQPPERESPRRERGESSLRDVARPDTKGKVAGGPEHHISDRSQPVKDCVSDRSKPINDDRLSALEELSAMDQELELKHGITDNPLIKAQRNKESAGAGITDAGPRLRQMNDVLEENERLQGQLAWTERERDSLRVSINNLRDYVSELNAELFAASAAKTDTTQPRNGALDEPVAWANFYPDEEFVDFDRDYVEQCSDEGEVVPLYSHPQPTLTDEEREAIAGAIDVLEQEDQWHAVGEARIKTLRKLLERLRT